MNGAVSQYKTLAKEKVEDMRFKSLEILLVDYDYEHAYQTWEEILSLSTFIGDTEMIEEADRDGDGEIGEEDFIKVMKKTNLF